MKELFVIVLLMSLSLITFWPPMRCFLNGYLARLDVAVSGTGEQRGHLYYYFLFGSIFVSFWLIRSRFYFLKPHLPGLVLITSIILMTGIVHSLTFSSLIVNMVVGSTIGLGTFGLYSMHQSLGCRDKNKRWLLLLTGFLSVLIAYFTLEGLL